MDATSAGNSTCPAVPAPSPGRLHDPFCDPPHPGTAPSVAAPVLGEHRDPAPLLRRGLRPARGQEDLHARVPTGRKPDHGVESEAASMRCFAPVVLPGLLQAEDYARTVIHGVVHGTVTAADRPREPWRGLASSLRDRFIE